MFVVKIDDYWLADWEGDPGRTLVLNNAKIFSNRLSGGRALRKTTKQNPHRNMTKCRVLEVFLTETPTETAKKPYEIVDDLTGQL
jgi:hypothetical protein